MEGEDESLEALMARIPAHRPATTPSWEMAKCCCGRTDCAFLKNNCSALDELEREVRTAAQLGQVRAFVLHHGGNCGCARCCYLRGNLSCCGEGFIYVGFERSCVFVWEMSCLF